MEKALADKNPSPRGSSIDDCKPDKADLPPLGKAVRLKQKYMKKKYGSTDLYIKQFSKKQATNSVSWIRAWTGTQRKISWSTEQRKGTIEHFEYINQILYDEHEKHRKPRQSCSFLMNAFQVP